MEETSAVQAPVLPLERTYSAPTIVVREERTVLGRQWSSLKVKQPDLQAMAKEA